MNETELPNLQREYSAEHREIIRLSQIGILCLRRVYQDHQMLGEAGKQEVRKNGGGDMALRADIDAEKKILTVLNEFDLPIRTRGEETGDSLIGDINSTKYTGVMDGLDGTRVYKDNRGRFGTMFAIFGGIDPNYEDYLFAGIMDHITGDLTFAAKGRGAFNLNVENNRVTRIHTNQKAKKLTRDTVLYGDREFDNAYGVSTVGRYLDGKFEMLRERPFPLGSSAIAYANIADGSCTRERLDNGVAAIEVPRKNNLEIAVMCGIITEAGGAIRTIDDDGLVVDLLKQNYFSFSQYEDTPEVYAGARRPVVTAATEALAEDILKEMGVDAQLASVK